MLEIKNLKKQFGGFLAVNDLNMAINDGSLFGFVGPNGAGKTTTMRIISGLLTSTSGKVMIDDINIMGNPKLISEKIGYMPDFFGVYDNLKVSEYMDFYAGAYYLPYGERAAIINRLLDLVNLSDKSDVYVDSLSRGMKQRLCLARSLVHDPSILVLDEPASGLDPMARIELKEILKRLKTLGKTIIISSHILPELAELCNVIGIIDKGNLIAFGSIEEITKKTSVKRIITVKTLSTVDKTNEITSILKKREDVLGIEIITNDITFSFSGNDEQLSMILSEIINENIPLIGFKEQESNLESIFMDIVNPKTAGKDGESIA